MARLPAMSSARRLLASIGVAALVIAVTTGCSEGEDGGPGATASSTAATTAATSPAPPDAEDSASTPVLPPCDEVWVDDHVLPRGYRGCDDAGTAVDAMVVGCSSGQRIVLYDDHYWAVRGNRIHETPSALLDDPDYQSAIAACRA